MFIRACLAALLLLGLSATTACADERHGAVYDAEADAASAIDAALAAARDRDVPAFIVLGANWCHDSRGLADRIEADETLNAFIAEEFELVFVDIGERDRNLDQLARFGVDQIFGTPTLVVADSEGRLLNAKSVHHWRTADNAGAADVASYLATHADVAAPIIAEASADLTAVINAWPSYIQALAALETSDLDASARAVRAAYYEGFARSMARRALGLEAEEQELDAVDSANLPERTEPPVDLTEAVIARLADRDMDLVARGDNELSRYEADDSADTLTGQEP